MTTENLLANGIKRLVNRYIVCVEKVGGYVQTLHTLYLSLIVYFIYLFILLMAGTLSVYQ